MSNSMVVVTVGLVGGSRKDNCFLTGVDLYRIDKIYTRAVFYPYGERKELAKETGRDYKKEADLCCDFLVKFTEKIQKTRIPVKGFG